jgi:signal peptidase II
MQLNTLKKIITFYWVIIFFGLDQFLKDSALKQFSLKSINLVHDLLVFRAVKNYYIAFSLPFISGKWLIMATLAILIFLASMLYKMREEHSRIVSISLILAGAISNLVDRIYYGFVIDYFDLKYFTVFNIADMMIVSGSLLLVYSVYFGNKAKPPLLK